MKKLIWLPVLWTLSVISVSAQSPNYGSGFTSTTGLTLNGFNGAAATNGTHLRLTDGGGSEGRSVFFSMPVNVQSFTNNFTFQLTNANADGFTFAIQGIGPTALGSEGGGLGYTGIGSSVGVGFQLYSSVLGFKEVSLTGDWTNGAPPDKTPGTDTTGSGVNIHSGDVMSVHMTYDGTTLTWTITDTTTSKSFTKSVAINIPALTGNTAYVGFTGGDGGLTAVQDVLTWTFTPGGSPVPPSITTQPANQTVTVGQSATFSVVATGTAPLTYQWQQSPGSGSGFTNISGGTSSSYTTPPTNSSNQGNMFDVIVSNSAGPVTSNAATLTVTSSASSINFGSGFTSAGLALNGGATINGTHLRLTDGGGSEGRSAFFNTPMNVQSFVNDFSFQLTNANADGFTFTIQGIGPTALGSKGGGLGYTGIGSSVGVGFQLYSSVLGFKEVSLTGDWTNGAPPDKTPGTDTTGSGVNIHSGDVMSVHMTYDGTTLTWTITDTTTSKSFTKSVAINIPALTGNTAYVGFTGGDGGLTAVQDILTWTYTPSSAVPPSITTQPANQTVTVGQTATFSVVASGTAPLSYQWLQNTGSGFTAISGANSSSYTTPATTSNNNGNTFEVTVNNSVGPSVTSNAATLTVGAAVPPSITTQPANQTVTVGQTATFSVVASGTAPLSYQWLQNTGSGFAAISGANSSSYTTPATTANNNGNTFEVMVTNSIGSVTSNTVTLTVTAAPTGPSYGSGLTAAGMTMNGGAAIAGSARLRLTDGGGSEARSAFFVTPVNVQSFTTTFTFQLTNANADGFTFTIQNNSATALGHSGGGLGYSGIPQSVAVGFQLYKAGSEVSLAGLWTKGTSPDSAPGTDMSGSLINLHSGDLFKVRISYDGTTLSMYIRDLTNSNDHFFMSFPINIPGTVGGSTAYVGFTGGDGGLTATQDILSWSYSNSTGGSGTFIWPVTPPAVVGASDYSTTAFGGQYHTGLDLCPAAVGCQRGNPVFATADGTVQGVFVTSDPAQTMCDGSSTGSLAHNDTHLGNTVIIAHSNGKFSLYGNMDCVWPGIAPGVPVSQGARIGNSGNSQYGVRFNTWTPHVHFEIKDAGVVADPATGNFASFTPDLPDGYGYHDPYLYLFPSSQSNMSPTAVKVTASPFLNVLTGPDTSYSSLNFVTTGQEFVAFASSGSWYQVYLPNSQGPISGWIPASAGSQILSNPDSTATKIQVTNAGVAGLLVRPSASAATNLVTWDNNSGFVANPTPDCTSTFAKIWDGQSYVMIATQSGFDEFYLPSNLYFSSANTCAQPTGPFPSLGWASSSFLQ